MKKLLVLLFTSLMFTLTTSYMPVMADEEDCPEGCVWDEETETCVCPDDE